VGIVTYGYLAVGLIIALESMGFRYPARACEFSYRLLLRYSLTGIVPGAIIACKYER
jgi:hypothetical protein